MTRISKSLPLDAPTPMPECSCGERSCLPPRRQLTFSCRPVLEEINGLKLRRGWPAGISFYNPCIRRHSSRQCRDEAAASFGVSDDGGGEDGRWKIHESSRLRDATARPLTAGRTTAGGGRAVSLIDWWRWLWAQLRAWRVDVIVWLSFSVSTLTTSAVMTRTNNAIHPSLDDGWGVVDELDRRDGGAAVGSGSGGDGARPASGVVWSQTCYAVHWR